MDFFFIIGAMLCLTCAIILLIFKKLKSSELLGNIAFVLIMVSVLLFGAYALDVDSLFSPEHSSDYHQVTTSAHTTAQNNGRPVKKDNSETTQSAPNGFDIVYITRNGEKYHLSLSCGEYEFYECTLEQALSRGLSPCKKCAQ